MPLVRLECMMEPKNHGKNQTNDLIWEADIPEWCVGAAAVCFHSSHEGHMTRLIVDGREIYPDPDAGPPSQDKGAV